MKATAKRVWPAPASLPGAAPGAGARRCLRAIPIRRRGLIALFPMLGLFLLAPTLGAAPAVAGGALAVMTQNQYLGGELTSLLNAPDPAAFNTRLVQLLRRIAATDFPARARRQAEAIARRAPDLIALHRRSGGWPATISGHRPWGRAARTRRSRGRSRIT